jgi:hypothetical protein
MSLTSNSLLASKLHIRLISNYTAQRLQLRERFSAGDQVGKADSFDINDAASLGEQKDVGRGGAKKAAVALRMTEILIDIDEIFGGARRAGVENIQMRKREQHKIR